MTDITLPEPPFIEQGPPSVGEILKAARLERGLTLEQVSESLRINKRHLSHLEENEASLVCDVYTLGFLKMYAQYLELSTQDVIEKFKNQAVHHPKSSQLIFPAPLPGRGIPSFRILALSLFALVTIIIGWKWVGNYSSPPYPSLEPVVYKDEAAAKTKIEEPATPPAAQQTFSSPPIETTPVETTHSNPESTPQQVHLQITEEAWIEVKDEEGNLILNRIFHPGESFEFKNSENLILKTGNLKGTRLSSGEKVFPIVGKSGEVGRNIPLDPQKWLEQQTEAQ